MNVLAEVETVKVIDDIITKVLYDNNKHRAEYYVDAKTYMRGCGVGNTLFYEWKRQGKLEKGIYPPSRGGKHCLYHKYFNVHSQCIELPELKRLPIQHRSRRKSNAKTEAEQSNGIESNGC